ncbi:MAG: AAA family ATPase [Bacteroidaceae bacterium]|nr:AAA family ATPase [Bacteroidaceae bacterium]
MITKLGIKGYKSIRDQKIDLKPVNILIGGNGIGKSNFISVFDLMRNLYEKELQSYIMKKGGADVLLYINKRQTSCISIDLEFVHDTYHNRYMVNLQEAHDSLFISDSSTAFLRDKKWYYQRCDVDKKEATIKDDKKGQAWYVSELMGQFRVYHFHDAGDTSPMKSKSNIDDNISLRRDGGNIASFLYFLQERHPKSFKRIEMAVQAVSPFFGGFALVPDRLNPKVIQLEWKQRGVAETYFNAYQLSDGTLRFICLATLLLQPNPPQTIIVDEPELGLHPMAINKLSALIKKASEKSQIIVSTQSVNLVDNFGADDIIVVDMKDNASHFHRLDKESLSLWLEHYSIGELWEKNLIGGLPF